MKATRKLFVILSLFSLLPVAYGVKDPALVTASIQQSMTPDDAIARLKRGNERFYSNKLQKVDYLKKAKLSASGQHPVAVVLSCIDSRVPPEIVFNQAIANIFVTRTAANVINSDILGGMEFATKVAGAKVIVVMGHDSCGAVRGACENVKLGKLTQLLDKIQPAINSTTHAFKKKECNNPAFIDQAAQANVLAVVKMIPEESSVIRELVNSGQVKIVGAMYHLQSGKVTFLN